MRWPRSLAEIMAVLAIASASLPADAVTLGRARGAILLGRPLSVAIPLTLDQGETEPCVQAELFQGDTRTGALDATVQQSETGLFVRLRSTAVIEEPVITLYVRVGCGQQYTRSYVLLAEQLQETPSAPLTLAPSTGLGALPRANDLTQQQQQQPGTAPPSQPAPAASPDTSAPLALQPSAPPSRPAARAAPAARAQERQAQAGTQAAAARTPPRRAAARDDAAPKAATPARPRATPGAETVAQAPKQRGPRLRLESPVDLEVEQAAPLKLSPQMAAPSGSMVVGALPGAKAPASAPATAPQATAAPPKPAGAASTEAAPPQRTEAAAARKALAKTPEEVAGESMRSEAIAEEVKALRDAMQKHAAATAQLAEQLEKVRSERDIASTLLAVIAALLIAGGMAMLWLRSRESSTQQARWRQMAAVPPEPVDSHVPESIVGQSARMPMQGPASEVDSGWEGMSQMNSSGGQSQDNDVELRRPKPAVASPMSEFAESQVGHSRLPKPQELIDIQQKVEFFLAIGQHERAIELLEAQIHDYLGSSPLVWLDLMDLCHQFGKREQYERIREEFQHEFSARLPTFDANRPDSTGLEDHPRALSRIELLWGSPRVLKVIEESLFEDPHAPGSITFDLHASRDLLLLYAIARETVPQEGQPEPSPEDDYTEFIKTSLSPMPQSPLLMDDDEGTDGPPAPTTEPVPLATLDEQDTDLPLVPVSPDIDLGFLSEPPPEPMPEMNIPDMLGEEPSATPAPTPAPETVEFDFDFEPRARTGGRTVL